MTHFNGKPLNSFKQLGKKIPQIKQGKVFSIHFKRKNKKYKFTYKVVGKFKWSLIKKTNLNKKRISKKSKKSSKKLYRKKQTKTQKKITPAVPVEKKNVFKKYKNHLQQGYIIALNGIIYKRANFDAKQIFFLPSGTKVLMSKKIFTPSHKFGTFYKVFIKKPKKIVGYVSEVEVVSEYVNYGKKIELNPRYQLVERQLNKNGEINFKALYKNDKKSNNENNSIISDQVSLSPFLAFKYFIGPVFGYKNYANQQGLFTGIQANTKISHIKTEAHFYVSPINTLPYQFPSNWQLNVLAGYPLIGISNFIVYIMGGLAIENTYKYNSDNAWEGRVNVGPLTSLSSIFPLTQKLFMRTNLSFEYKTRMAAGAASSTPGQWIPNISFSGALQMGF